MKKRSRLGNSVYNFASGAVCRILSLFLAFFVRTVFIKTLGEEYLGINGLYSNILSMLSLMELGFGTAMVYSMYKPLAEEDYQKLGQLVRLYKRVYGIIGTVILILGLSLVPFLDLLIKNKPDIEGLTFYYILFLLNTVISYWFFAYRTAIFQADQRNHVISNYQAVFSIVKTVLQIIVLLIFKNFTLYLLTQTGCTIVQNISLAYKAKNEYDIFDRKVSTDLPKSETKKIFSDVKALMLQKISFTVLNSSDSLIISAFVGINWVGLLSNFVMIEEAITSVLCQITSAVSASLGNYFAKETDENGYRLFKRIEFLNFWLYSFSAIALMTLLNPFVELWLGKNFIISEALVFAIVMRFFMAGYMNTLSIFRSTLGLFVQGKYLPLLVAFLNVVLSILMSLKWGAFGVLIATPITRLCVNAWYTPLVIHKHGFHRSVRPFYAQCIAKCALTGVFMLIMSVISHVILANGITVLNFIVLTLLTGMIPNVAYILIFHRRDEFTYFSSILVRIVKKLNINR